MTNPSLPSETEEIHETAYVYACKHIASQIQSRSNLSRHDIAKIVRNASGKYCLSTLPRNQDIIGYLDILNSYRKVLMVKPVKTASGVVIIAVMPKPYACPQGRCVYCPGGISANTPLSYTGREPATMLAQKFEYNPFDQIRSKLFHIRSLGHDAGKVEIVIVGGTFPFMPHGYQREFVKLCFDALNHDNDKSVASLSLYEAMKTNETAKTRCVGLTVETKPDYCKEQHIDLMLEMGITRVEVGVQSLQEDVYKAVNRGHDLDDVIESFQIARDSGLKIVAHMMPGLPGSSPEKDIQDFTTLLENPLFKPDMLKIYPTLVLKDTPLYKLYRSGRYTPYSQDELIDILIAVKKKVPPWIRIMRVQREIEPMDIIAGPKFGNLRQIVLRKLHDQGLRCNCIRCREVGSGGKMSMLMEDITLHRIDYWAARGTEVFLAFENSNHSKILGFLRLRRIKCSHRKELKQDSAIVRELHIYGPMLNVGSRGDRSYQHSGFGALLMQEAERIASQEFGVRKLSVISAVGTREYYKKLGYENDGPYMSKVL
ncbi:MAG TPA: tRNA uridine(34) 5-carboxymethylaminomethyl modification radical SAM/GNAT enzyme Elp3 [Candidatus Nitrosopolaris sp.]|nr:tRNA uridine(34) 5-carboxymethylaminomethyl modification radical SAM/GNAT enzyme Elp3 [Candidatus Nitrosopolaris sp.]